jgi:NAD(P)H-flavin reductase
VPVDQAIDRFWAGQFAMVYLFGVGEIPVSISGCPLGGDDTLTFTVRSVGAVSDALCRARAGAVVGIRGPFGTSWDVDDAVGGDLLFVAGGIGLAPLRSALLEALAVRGRFGRITVVAGAKSPGELLFTDEYESWRARGAQVAITVDRVPLDPCTLVPPAWDGPVGLVTSLLADVHVRTDRTVAYLCGPEVMMPHTGTALTELGVPPEQIRLSIERNMRCAVGVCGHCQLGPDLICRDGPVTTLDHAMPLLAVAEL